MYVFGVAHLAKTTSLALRLHEVQNISLTNGALNVTNNSTGEREAMEANG